MNQYYVPDFEVKIEGLTMSADVTNFVTELTYDNNFDTADMFTLRLNNADLRFTDLALFDVGKNVEVYMGYVGDLHPMMLGEITAVNPSFPQSGAPTITITGYDKSHRMRHNNEAREFKYVNDSLIAAQIAAENLLIPVIDPAPMPREHFYQNGSDWAFLTELSERNFFQVYVYWDKLYFRFPRPQTEMVVLEWGKNLTDFSPRLSTSGQVGIQVIRGYDYELAQKIVAILPAISLGSDLDDIIERLGSSFVDQLVKLGRSVIRNKTVDNYLDAATLAKSILMEILQGLFEGTGSTIGNPKLRAGDTVEIRGIGKRFSGKYRLSKVTHTISTNGYITQFEVSQRNTSTLLQSLRKKLTESPSPNEQEKIYGTVIGKVEDNTDLKRLGRVQVSFPSISDVKSYCARVSSLTAGGDLTKQESWGMYFLPEKGDEVLVSFEHGDINKPVIVGSLWNGLARPPETNDTGLNEAKVIKTKSGMQIMFDETPGRENLLLKDKAGSMIIMDSTTGSEQLVLQDKTGSKITMDSITGDIIIEAKSNVIINKGENGAARKEDHIKSTSAEDPKYWTWLSGFINVFTAGWVPVPMDGGAALKTALTTYLSANPVPSELTGKIIEGSNSVKIGD